MQPNNTTMPNVASQAISVSPIVTQNRSVVNILYDIRETVLRRDRLSEYFRFLANEIDSLETHYEDAQVSFDDFQDQELLEGLCSVSSDIVTLGQQLAKTEAELDKAIQRIDDLRTELHAAQKGKFNE